jgi:hypothetical protein
VTDNIKYTTKNSEIKRLLTEFFAANGDDYRYTAAEFVDATAEMISKLEIIRANEHWIVKSSVVNDELKKLWETLRVISPLTVNHLNGVSGGEPVKEMMYLAQGRVRMLRFPAVGTVRNDTALPITGNSKHISGRFPATCQMITPRNQ